MLTVPTALLDHRTASGRHYDWLVGTPGYRRDISSGLWTARTAHPSGDWRALGGFDLTVITEHRRAYLAYQGAVSGGRGTVLRVDRGLVGVRMWSGQRMVWAVRMKHFEGQVEARRVGGNLWRARVIR